MKYDEIINLPHYEPKYHKRMSKSQRAAQFSPFSALTGYDEMVKEIERLTKDKIIISDDEINVINEKLNYLIQNKMLDSYVSITYFVKDLKKDGGNLLSLLLQHQVFPRNLLVVLLLARSSLLISLFL